MSTQLLIDVISPEKFEQYKKSYKTVVNPENGMIYKRIGNKFDEYTTTSKILRIGIAVLTNLLTCGFAKKHMKIFRSSYNAAFRGSAKVKIYQNTYRQASLKFPSIQISPDKKGANQSQIPFTDIDAARKRCNQEDSQNTTGISVLCGLVGAVGAASTGQVMVLANQILKAGLVKGVFGYTAVITSHVGLLTFGLLFSGFGSPKSAHQSNVKEVVNVVGILSCIGGSFAIQKAFDCYIFTDWPVLPAFVVGGIGTYIIADAAQRVFSAITNRCSDNFIV